MTAAAPVAAALLLGALSACGGTPTQEIRFLVESAGAPVTCDGSYDGGVGGARWTLTDLRLFVHDLRAVTAEGDEVPLALVPDGRWQNAAVALLDFEDGSGDCLNGTAERRDRVRVRVPPGDYRALRFTVGVPFSHNHRDPVKASPPLSYTFMHWGWQSGYKFMRLGLRAGDHAAFLHLGSTQCRGTFTDIEGCDLGNRPTAEVPLAGDRPWAVTLDVAKLTKNVLVPGPTEGSKGCMSQVDNPRCTTWFDNLGLNLQTGAPRWTSAVFRAP